jgi:hypothetical protein
MTDLSLQARLLLPEDRIRLAEELLASLDPHVADVEQGLVALVSAKTAFAEVRSILQT